MKFDSISKIEGQNMFSFSITIMSIYEKKLFIKTFKCYVDVDCTCLSL